MNLKTIKAIERKAEKEAEKAVKRIYAKYNKELHTALANMIPKGETLISGNGICIHEDKNGNDKASGKAWGLAKDEQLDYIASLQYYVVINGGFVIDHKIKGNK
jgi:hypothetical protein